MTVYEKINLRYPVILARDVDLCILNNCDSERTRQYMDNTISCQTDECKQAFRAGMIYAALLISTECYQFGDVATTRAEIKAYNEFQ